MNWWRSRSPEIKVILLASIAICLICACGSIRALFEGNNTIPASTPVQFAVASPTRMANATAVSPEIPAPGSAIERPTPVAPMNMSSPFAGMTVAHVTEVVDGDTIKVLIDGVEYSVRYIGIDTPETVHPNMDVQWMGPEASSANKALVQGQTVYLEKDVSETDRYGRLLRYVWLLDGCLVNEELVRQGYAQVSTYPPDVKYQDRFLAAERAARDSGLGLWGMPPVEAPSPTRVPRVAATVYLVPAQPAQNCDPSYPTVCIPFPPPDLDCKDVPFRRFKVVPPDPHRFDGDNDGIGCES